MKLDHHEGGPTCKIAKIVDKSNDNGDDDDNDEFETDDESNFVDTNDPNSDESEDE